MKNYVALVLALVVAAAAVPSAAVDNCLKQGEFALALAEKVRLAPASEGAAVKSLADIGIKPDDGWKPAVFLDDKSFNEIDRSVIVAFAAGKLAGNPSAARAVLAGVSMPGACHDRYFVATPAAASADMLVMPIPLEGGDGSVRPEVPRQQTASNDEPAELPNPPVYESGPGIEDPEPGKKQPSPISTFEPWDGPTRPGPGRKEPAP